MTAASRSLATALWGARFASGLLPQSYTTSWDTTSSGAQFRISDRQNAEVLAAALWVEGRDVAAREVGTDVGISAALVPRPKLIPIIRPKITACAITPCNKMPPVVRRKDKSVCLVIRCDDDAAAIRNAVFPQVLLIDRQNVRGGRDIRLRMVIELVAIEFPLVASLADAENDALQKAVEAAHDGDRRYFLKIP